MKTSREEQIRIFDEQERSTADKMLRALQQLRWRQAQEQRNNQPEEGKQR